jgi:hypothetical protein
MKGGLAVTSSDVYRRRDETVLRQVAGENLLIPIHRRVPDMQAIFALAGSGLRIWELLDGTRTLGAVRDALVERFEVSAEVAWTDLCVFVGQLEEKGLVERRG